MKILLTTLNSKFIHSSLALRYLKSYCKSEFSNIHIEEYTVNNDLDYILGEIYKKNYDLVGFSCYIWNINETLQIAKNLKKVKQNVKILLGGPEVSYDVKQLLDEHEYIDYIICCEGEETFKELLKCIIKKQGYLNEIQGLAYRTEDGKIFINKERPLIENLDDIPFPYVNLKELENKIIYYESSRGCPFNCQYCLSSTIRGVRYFSLDRVKRDLNHFVEAGVKQVKFVDRTFNANKQHCLDIMKYIEEIDNGKINFHFEITADLFNDEMLNYLKGVRPGLFQFEIGVQSTNAETLKEIKRNVDFEILSDVCKKLASFRNIHLHLDLIAGLPFEDYKTFLKSFNEVYNLKPNKLQLGFLKLLKGSGIRINQEKYGYVYKDNPPYEVMANNHITYDEILRLKFMEEMLEQYYNSHNFSYSIEFIINNFFNGNPAAFYESLSIYWETMGYHHISHKRDEIYRILLEFYQKNEFGYEELFKEILKFDYVRNKKGNLPDYFDNAGIENFKQKCHDFLHDEENIKRYLPKYIGQPVKKIIKNIHFENFKYNVLDLIEGNINEYECYKGITTILFDYDVENTEFGRSKYYKIYI